MRYFTLFFSLWLSLTVCSQQLPPHPRLLFAAGAEDAIKEKLPEKHWQNYFHTMIVRQSNEYLQESFLDYEIISGRLLLVSRLMRERIVYLAYSYRMTGNVDYLNRAKEEMLHVCNFPDWHPPHFLDVVEMAAGVAIGYDWLYDELSEETRQTIRESLYQKAIIPSRDVRYNDWLQIDDNWNQVCNAALLLTAYAIYEDYPAEAQDIIDRSVNSVQNSMSMYEPDGNYPEGAEYWGYGTTYLIQMLSQLELINGEKYDNLLTEGLKSSAHYCLHVTGPSFKTFNYGDANPGCSLETSLFWFAKRLNDPSLLWMQNKLLTESDPLFERLLVDALIWNPEVELTALPEPDQYVWKGEGVTPVGLMRTGWGRDAHFAGIKGGKASVNHGHMDVGSFVLDFHGKRWLMDMGPEDYSRIEEAGIDLWNMTQDSPRWDLFRYNNKGHNTLVFDDRKQQVDGIAPILECSENSENFMYGIVDLNDPYKGQVKDVKRGIALANKAYAMVQDEIRTGNQGVKLRWNLCSDKVVAIDSENNRFKMSYGTQHVYVEVSGFPNARPTIWPSNSGTSYEDPNGGITIFGFEGDLEPDKDYRVIVRFIPEENYDSSQDILNTSLENWKLITGLDETSVERQASGLLNVSGHQSGLSVSSKAEKGVLSIYTAEGQECYRTSIYGAPATVSLPRGIYILRFLPEGGEIETHKAVVGF